MCYECVFFWFEFTNFWHSFTFFVSVNFVRLLLFSHCSWLFWHWHYINLTMDLTFLFFFPKIWHKSVLISLFKYLVGFVCKLLWLWYLLWQKMDMMSTGYEASVWEDWLNVHCLRGICEILSLTFIYTVPFPMKFLFCHIQACSYFKHFTFSIFTLCVVLPLTVPWAI